ncbi:MAG: TonB-dependent receptor [Pseudohongiellaceae bacterium]|nr:TonB-dependent receptor [Pseudohongiellaceae bacterium]
MTRQQRHRPKTFIFSLIATCLTSTGLSYAAELTPMTIETIEVFGSQLKIPGKPKTAAEGFVFGNQLQLRPVSRPAELLEFVPGLIATQHSGEGKGNQYFLRGFNLDHGTDLALTIDGLPVNMPSHAHGQGYADLNFLIPELVSSLSYKKGPYYGDIGDFGTAGSSQFNYTDYLDQPQVSIEYGEDDYQRVFAAGSAKVASGHLTLAIAQSAYEGPWTLDQDLDKRNALAKFSRQTTQGNWSITAMSYDNSWNATDQIPERAVQQNLLGRYGHVDGSDGGETQRHSLALKADMQSALGTVSLNAYAIDYELALFSNFTYFLDDPVRGDQFEQSERRHVLGFSSSLTRNIDLIAPSSSLVLGLQSRFDDIDVGLYKTQERIRHTITREDEVKQSLTSLYGTLDQQWTQRFRTSMALRFDSFNYDVSAGIPANSGDGRDNLVSPKANFIYSLREDTDLFLSAGRGFHSNDARGTTATIDPVSGQPIEKVDPLAKAFSTEVGIRSSALENTQIAASIFSLKLDSELLYVGDAGTTEALGGTKRKGVELGIIYTPTDYLLVDADVTATHARFKRGAAGRHIPNSVARTASLGISAKPNDNWDLGLRVRYLGEAALEESNTVRSDPTLLVNAQASYKLNPNITLSLSVFNLSDEKDNDITYYYESQLAGEVTSQEDIHFHPVEPRHFRLGLKIAF